MTAQINLFDCFRQWAHDRNIIKGSIPASQFVKLIEENGEMNYNIMTGVGIADDIGDQIVVLTILAEQHGLKLEFCNRTFNVNEPYPLCIELGYLAHDIARSNNVESSLAACYLSLKKLAISHKYDVTECMVTAWTDIKERKGQMVNGVFVKEVDL